MPADKLAEAIERVRYAVKYWPEGIRAVTGETKEDVLAVCDAAARVGAADCELYSLRNELIGRLTEICNLQSTLAGIERLLRAGPFLEISKSESLGMYAVAFGRDVAARRGTETGCRDAGRNVAGAR